MYKGMRNASILYINIYSKSMKTQHLYFRYLSNMDLSINILSSSDNCTLHILSNDQSLYWLIVNMHCFKVLVTKQVISRLPVMFRMSDLYFWIVFPLLTEWITFSQHQNVDMRSPYQNILRLNLEKLWTILELVAAVSWKVVICPVYELYPISSVLGIDIKINGEMMLTIEIPILQPCQCRHESNNNYIKKI